MVIVAEVRGVIDSCPYSILRARRDEVVVQEVAMEVDLPLRSPPVVLVDRTILLVSSRQTSAWTTLAFHHQGKTSHADMLQASVTIAPKRSCELNRRTTNHRQICQIHHSCNQEPQGSVNQPSVAGRVDYFSHHSSVLAPHQPHEKHIHKRRGGKNKSKVGLAVVYNSLK